MMLFSRPVGKSEDCARCNKIVPLVMNWKLCCVIVTLFLFSFSYAQADNKNSSAGTLKVEVLEYIGHEEEGGYCGSLHAEKHLDTYGCMAFIRGDGSQGVMYMWRKYASLSTPTKRSDLLVAYLSTPMGNEYYTSIAKPRPATVYTDTVVFLGKDTYLPNENIFIFKNSYGDDLYLDCQESFCSEILDNKNKKMVVTHQREYRFSKAKRAFEEGDFVQHYNLLN